MIMGARPSGVQHFIVRMRNEKRANPFAALIRIRGMQPRLHHLSGFLSVLRDLVARRWVGIVLFKVNWLLLVAGQGRWLLLVLGCTLPLQILAGMAPNATRGQGDHVFKACLLYACLGMLIDQALGFAGVLAFPGRWLPGWLVALWLAFGFVLPQVSALLRRLPVYAWSVLGAIVGTLSYHAGAALGAVVLVQPLWLSSTVLAVIWSVLLPLWHLLSLRAIARRRLLQFAVCGWGLMFLLALAPRPVHATESDLAFVGRGHYRFLAMTVYDITLRTAQQPFDFPGTVPFELIVEYRRGFSSEQITAETRRQWRKQEVVAQVEWQQWLDRSVPDVAAGDTLTLHVDAQYASHFFHNGELISSVADPDFSIAFAGIWLGANTSAPHLRAQLLGQSR